MTFLKAHSNNYCTVDKTEDFETVQYIVSCPSASADGATVVVSRRVLNDNACAAYAWGHGIMASDKSGAPASAASYSPLPFCK